MIKAHIVTLLVSSVLCLVGGMLSPAEASTATKAQTAITNKVVVSADQIIPEEKSVLEFSGGLSVSRSTLLIDFGDGSRKDSMYYLFAPALKTKYGSFSSRLAFLQDLRDQSPEKSDFFDVPVSFAFNSTQWAWSYPYILTFTPTLSSVIPISQTSIKKDQLQTAFVGGISFAIIPDGVAPKKDGAWNLAMGITAGRIIHAYEQDINGAVLNKYLSNQTLNLGYTYKDFSISNQYIHMSRFTYQGSTKDSFYLSQDIGYSINDNFSLGIGHSNSGNTLKVNGTESNISLINENDSTVYGEIAVSF